MNPELNLKEFIRSARESGKYTDTQIRQYLEMKGAIPAQEIKQPPKFGVDVVDVDDVPSEEKVGLGKSLVRGFASPLLRSATNIRHAGGVASDTARRIGGQEVEARDTSQPLSFGNFLGEARPVGQTGNFGRDIADAAGVGAELGGFVTGGGKVAQTALQSAKGVGRFLPNMLKGAKQGIFGGGIAGTGIGAQQEDSTLGSTATSGLLGSAMGGVAGGAIAGATTGGRNLFNYAQNSRARTAQLNEILTDSTKPITQRMNERMGGLPLKEVLKKDKNLQEAVTQGIDPGTSALVRYSNPDTKKIMSDILNFRVQNIGNKTQRSRATDKMGKPFIERVKILQLAKKRAGKEVGDTGRNLQGQTADFTPVRQQLADDLYDIGYISLGEKGDLVFDESLFRDMPSVKKQLTLLWKDSEKIGDNAFEAHKLKQRIDVVIDYAKQNEGLPGKSQLILKNFRHRLDDVLDGKFPEYKKANDKFRDILTILDDVSQQGGEDLINGGDLASGRAGMILRRMYGNSANRENLLQTLGDVEISASKYGYQGKDDIFALGSFINSLDDIIGTETQTALSNDVTRGVNQAVTGKLAGADLSSAQGVMNTIRGMAAKAQGINQDNAIRALRELLLSR